MTATTTISWERFETMLVEYERDNERSGGYRYHPSASSFGVDRKVHIENGRHVAYFHGGMSHGHNQWPDSYDFVAILSSDASRIECVHPAGLWDAICQRDAESAA